MKKRRKNKILTCYIHKKKKKKIISPIVFGKVTEIRTVEMKKNSQDTPCYWQINIMFNSKCKSLHSVFGDIAARSSKNFCTDTSVFPIQKILIANIILFLAVICYQLQQYNKICGIYLFCKEIREKINSNNIEFFFIVLRNQ